MDKPSYYAIIPANVRYDANLKPAEKLMYGEITCLAHSSGYCTAGNAYFAELYQVDKATVSRWIARLAKRGYLSVTLSRNEQGMITKRSIGLVKNITTPVDEKINPPLMKKSYKNNTSTNITSSNTIHTHDARINALSVHELSINTLSAHNTSIHDISINTTDINGSHLDATNIHPADVRHTACSDTDNNSIDTNLTSASYLMHRRNIAITPCATGNKKTGGSVGTTPHVDNSQHESSVDTTPHVDNSQHKDSTGTMGNTEPTQVNNRSSTTHNKTAQSAQPRFNALNELSALGVDAQLAQDWLTIRKAKRAPLTKTALNGVINEAIKAHITLSQAIQCAAERGWQGFKADWFNHLSNGNPHHAANQSNPRPVRHTLGNADRIALHGAQWLHEQAAKDAEDQRIACECAA